MLWVVVSHENKCNNEKQDFLKMLHDLNTGIDIYIFIYECKTPDEANIIFDEYREQCPTSNHYIVSIENLEWLPFDLSEDARVIAVNGTYTHGLD